MAKPDGGAAFPSFERWEQMDNEERLRECQAPVGGMKLRDYFAAKALSVVMQSSDIQDALSWDAWTARVSKVAYEVADAMLLERAK